MVTWQIITQIVWANGLAYVIISFIYDWLLHHVCIIIYSFKCVYGFNISSLLLSQESLSISDLKVHAVVILAVRNEVVKKGVYCWSEKSGVRFYHNALGWGGAGPSGVLDLW